MSGEWLYFVAALVTAAGAGVQLGTGGPWFALLQFALALFVGWPVRRVDGAERAAEGRT